MDAKIKELLTRLSFFAADGMGEEKLVEIAKQADALLLEVARKQNTQQPVAWLVERHAFRASQHGQDAEGNDWLEVTNEGYAKAFQVFAAPPVPRDVLMAFGEAIQKDCLAQLVKAVSTEHAQLLVEGVDLAAIADRYASKVQPDGNCKFPLCQNEQYQQDMAEALHRELYTGKPEPVNQQLLVALKGLCSINDETITQHQRAVRWLKAHEAIAAAEAAQCKCQRLGDYDGRTHHMLCDAPMPTDDHQPNSTASSQPVAVPDGIPTVKPRRPYDDDHPDGYLESDRDFIENNREAVMWFLEHADELRAMKTDCQQPAIAQPMAVPDERAAFEAWAHSKAYSVRKFQSGDYYYEQHETGCAWDAWQARAMLSAAQKTEGV